MFDIAPSELLLVAIIALIAIGPKDLPLALRTVGKWMGKIRRMSNHFRAGVDAMIREAELAEIEKEWQERNKQIMATHPDAEALETGPQMEPIDHSKAPPPENESTGSQDSELIAPDPELPLPPPKTGD